ncbi:MAG TPA: hypothetical protein VIN72_01945 [Lutibacter sp.]
MIVIFKYLIPKNYSGLAISPFIFLKNKKSIDDALFLNHEKIHLKQQVELLWIFFFVWYIIEYCIRFFQYKNHEFAYNNISFEKEAYKNEQDFNYLESRKKFSFLKYL